MKKIMMTLILAIGLITVVSAQTKKGETKTDKHEHMEKTSYACPMKCEGEKTYAKAGDCPKCGMHLTKNETSKTSAKKACCKAGNKKGHKCCSKKSSTASYSCPMKCEGDKTYSKAGKCPKCGMDLKKK